VSVPYFVILFCNYAPLYTEARALAAASTAIPIFETPIGRGMNWIEETVGTNLPRVVWDAASAVYAAGARGVAQVFITEPNSGYASTFYRIEAKIVEALGKAELNFNL